MLPRPVRMEAAAGRCYPLTFSMSTLNEKIASTHGARRMLLSLKRLETSRECKEISLLVGVNCIPALPFYFRHGRSPGADGTCCGRIMVPTISWRLAD